MKQVISRALLLAALLPLAACSGGEVKETLGLGKKVPDEFRVVERPPLSVPPVFNLRPPASPGEVVPSTNATGQARKIVTGSDAPASSDPAALDVDPSMQVDTAVTPVTSSSLASPAESSFLQKAGVDKKNPEIRKVIHSEVTVEQEKKEEKGIFDALRPSSSDEPVVNAKEERERIEKNKKDNKAVTEGKTPTHDPKKESTLDRLLK